MEVSLQLKEASATSNVLAVATVNFKIGTEPGDLLGVPGFLVLKGKPGKPPFCAEPVKTWTKNNNEKVRDAVLIWTDELKNRVKKKIMESYFVQRPPDKV